MNWNKENQLCLTYEQRKISDAKHKAASEYFNLPKGWVLHHKDTSLIRNDIERYIQWNIDDLVPMTRSDHLKLHSKLRFEDDDYRKSFSESHRGESNPMYGKPSPFRGKHFSLEYKKKISDGNKRFYEERGQWHWYTNGIDNKMGDTCPEGYWLGRTGGWKWHTTTEE